MSGIAHSTCRASTTSKLAAGSVGAAASDSSNRALTAAALAFVADGQRPRLRWALRGELLLVWLTFAFSLFQIGQRTALTVVTRGAARQPQLVDGAVGQVGTLLVSLGGPLLLVTALVPEIGYERATKIVTYAQANGLTLRQAALATGLIDAVRFDRLVRPETMVGPF